jgi:DNA invertase Pin-like site-specific DNA recombinase
MARICRVEGERMTHGKPHTGKFVAYYRVSTQRQGQSGLGLAAQQNAVREYLNGGSWELVVELTEIESGKHADRPELAVALEACRKHKAKLIIAKLDRLSRNVAFISALMDAGVEFIAVDMPEASRLTIHILAAVAEHEREAISRRTKDALAMAKARGVKLGNPRLDDVRAAAAESLKTGADQFATNVAPIIRDIQGAGITTLRGVADALNKRGIKTRRGRQWNASQVKNVLERCA